MTEIILQGDRGVREGFKKIISMFSMVSLLKNSN
jgi:hypothetical protein